MSAQPISVDRNEFDPQAKAALARAQQMLAQANDTSLPGMLGALKNAVAGQRVMAIEDGSGSAAAARVTGENNLGSEARNVNAGVVTTEVNVGTVSMQLVASRSERKQIQIQNLDPSNTLNIRLGGGTATTGDLMLAPGQLYSFPPGATADHEVVGVASGANTKVVVVEFT